MLRRALYALIALNLAVVVLAGCGPSLPSYIDEGAAYDEKAALALITEVDAGGIEAKSVTQAGALRHDALTRLRGKHGSAAQAAEMITRVFPSDTAGVPLYVERAVFEGEQAFLMVEAIGRPGGRLGDRRLWVLSPTGDVLLTGTR